MVTGKFKEMAAAAGSVWRDEVPRSPNKPLRANLALRKSADIALELIKKYSAKVGPSQKGGDPLPAEETVWIQNRKRDPVVTEKRRADKATIDARSPEKPSPVDVQASIAAVETTQSQSDA